MFSLVRILSVTIPQYISPPPLAWWLISMPKSAILIRIALSLLLEIPAIPMVVPRRETPASCLATLSRGFVPMPKFAFVSKLAMTLRVLVALPVLCRFFATPFSCPGPCVVGVAFVSLLFLPSFFRVDQQLSPGQR